MANLPNLQNLPKLPKIALTRNQIMMIGGVLVLGIVLMVLFSLGGSKGTTLPPVTIRVWGVDAEDAFAPIVNGYKLLHPNVTVLYEKVPAETYDQTVLTALAAGTGPDLFLIGNHDLLKRRDLLATSSEIQMTVPGLQRAFPQAVVQDLSYNNEVYAMPLYMDTLTLAYNKELFDQAGIAAPPKTWQEVLDMIPRLRVLEPGGQLQRAALAAGGGERAIDHATDIMNLIMLQNGTDMANDKGAPNFASDAGVAALRFYLAFADAGSPAYSWTDTGGGSIESFAAQRAAMALIYKSDINEIKTRSPFLDFAVAPAPQTSSTLSVNYPSYRALAVWVGSKVKPTAWDFAVFAATDLDAQGYYLNATGHPPALRELIARVDADPDLGMFGRAALTARSWKMGDYDKIKEIFSAAVASVQNGSKTPDAAIRDAATQAKQLLPSR